MTLCWRDYTPGWRSAAVCLARASNFELTPALQGTRLFKDGQEAFLLSPGDPIRLLWDMVKMLQLPCRIDHQRTNDRHKQFIVTG
jgi:hypothetical protein